MCLLCMGSSSPSCHSCTDCIVQRFVFPGYRSYRGESLQDNAVDAQDKLTVLSAFRKRLQGHVCRFLISQRQRLSGHLLSSIDESAGSKSCMSSVTLSISSIRLSLSRERERAGSWILPWRAQARYFSASLSQVRGFCG